MVLWVQAVCSSAARMASPASARALRSTSSADWCACRRTCSASARTVCAWVSASLRSDSASWAACDRTAAASSSAVIRSSSAARTVSSCWWRIDTVARVSRRSVREAVVASRWSVSARVADSSRSVSRRAVSSSWSTDRRSRSAASAASVRMAWRWDSAASSSRRTCSPASETDWRASARRVGQPGLGLGQGPSGLGAVAWTPRRAGAGTRTRAARRAPSRRRPAARPARAARRPPAGRAAATGRPQCRRAAHRRPRASPWALRHPNVGRSPAFRPSRPVSPAPPPTGIAPADTRTRGAYCASGLGSASWSHRSSLRWRHTGPVAGPVSRSEPREPQHARGPWSRRPFEGRSGQRRDDPGARPRPRRGAGPGAGLRRLPHRPPLPRGRHQRRLPVPARTRGRGRRGGRRGRRTRPGTRRLRDPQLACRVRLLPGLQARRAVVLLRHLQRHPEDDARRRDRAQPGARHRGLRREDPRRRRPVHEGRPVHPRGRRGPAGLRRDGRARRRHQHRQRRAAARAWP